MERIHRVIHVNWDKVWQWAMGLALPCTIGSLCADRNLFETLVGLLEAMSPARWVFLSSSSFLLVGFARNSARLRQILGHQASAGASPAGRRNTMFEPCND
jgi:hypothetical protein